MSRAIRTGLVALMLAVFALPAAPAEAVNGTPTVTVSPNTGLVDGQEVSVELTDFPPNTVTAIVQCVDGPGSLDLRCGIGATPGVAMDTDASGAVTFTYAVRRIIFTFGGGRFDCAQTSCVIVGGTGPYGGPHIDATSAPLGFVDTQLPPPEFSIAVEGPHFFNGDQATVGARLTCDRDETVLVVFHIDQETNNTDFTFGTEFPCTAGSDLHVFSEYFPNYEPGAARVFAGVYVNGDYVVADAETVTLQSAADTLAALQAALAGPDGDAVYAKLIADFAWRLTYNSSFAAAFARALSGH
jgi:hypothetical protein